MNQQEQQGLTNRTYPSVEATDDVEAHIRRDIVQGPETDEVEGHRYLGTIEADEATEAEDTEGHMQPPRDLDIDRI